MLSMDPSGNTKATDSFLSRILKGDLYSGLDAICQQGVMALAAATPRESGETAASWGYEIDTRAGIIWWTNSHVVDGFNVAVGLQYGHATGTGGWVDGYDYINPTLKPIFDAIADKIWKEVQRA